MARHSNRDTIAVGVFSVLMGIVATVLSGSIFNFFFVAMVIAILYDYNIKTGALQKKITSLESRLSDKSAASSSHTN